MSQAFNPQWDQVLESNLATWEDLASIHEKTPFYGLHQFNDPEYVTPTARTSRNDMAPHLPDSGLEGLDLCHLQCHLGTDTISLARYGAHVTGLDFSPSALETAAQLAQRTGVEATWVESDVLDARAAITGNFDVVYTSVGTINWINDLKRWARQIHGLLRPGGLFYFHDGHPIMFAGCITKDFPYFPDGKPRTYEFTASYAEFTSKNPTPVEHSITYQWPHSVSEIVTALLASGLRLEAIDEGISFPSQLSPHMVKVEEGWVLPAEERPLSPCSLTLIARRT